MSNIKLFEDKKIRVVWNEEKEDWYFSVVDVVGVLSGSKQPRKYWNDLKTKLRIEGSELSEKIGQLKLKSNDGKLYQTDVLDTKGILRLIQSIPSPKAEPFKLWLAQLGSERLEEISDPEKAILTNEMLKAWSGMTVKEYKKLKGIEKESLRDNMSNLEIVLNMLAEVTTTEISKKENPKNFEDNKKGAKKGGRIAYNTKLDIEKTVDEKIVFEKGKLIKNDKE